MLKTARGDNQGTAKNDNFEYSDDDGDTFEENYETNIFLPANPPTEETP